MSSTKNTTMEMEIIPLSRWIAKNVALSAVMQMMERTHLKVKIWNIWRNTDKTHFMLMTTAEKKKTKKSKH
jgi:hypothetical protein